MRGVTVVPIAFISNVRFQLTRLMRGVTVVIMKMYYPIFISTHTPHARRDLLRSTLDRSHNLFQLTRLMRGVTECTGAALPNFQISTHTPHARRD